MECYNFDFSLSLLLSSAAIYTSVFTNVNPFWFDLEQLRVHNKISVEHDASLSTYIISSLFEYIIHCGDLT